MGTLTRKQREIQQRESLLLDVARTMLMEHGFAGLSMDRLAEATEYSKGTIYQHFSTKEDLVAALAIQSLTYRSDLFDRASEYPGRPRERMFAIGVADELFARLHPQYYKAEMVIRMAALQTRADAERCKHLCGQDQTCMNRVRDIVASAVAAGDLALERPRTAEQVSFAVYSIALGTHLGMHNYGSMFDAAELGPPESLTRDGVQILLDGFGWRPLTTEWDYCKTYHRLIKDVFADEHRRLESL
ncbi:MAG: helix-turn-helix domain containing protein [Paludisphaera borealis]|uniref:TetR/AcrR family transcriptional regulator n=1 Tax=Paludisphaera borealis TaxID=1387353 RepID=UPI00283B23A0|nr:helix-turn-helix domain-containing protein [Paludisphaera borealis]MDR3618161.1 helix-turn-helix domain containing protein [Paludisphaera borealis]